MSMTIFDVAKRANVSISTVSRVLNNRDRVRPETRERVLDAIRALDYHTNVFAQGLASQHTNTFGLIIPQVNDPFFFGVVRGIEDTVTAAGYSLLIASQPHHRDDRHYMRLFRRGHVDALILVAVAIFPDELQEITTSKLPIILVQQDGGRHVPAVLVDNYGGACAMTEHLLQKHDYRRIAYITGTDTTPDNKERLRGVRDTLAAHNLSLSKELIFRGDYLRGSGEAALEQILDLPERPAAVFAGNDQMAADAMVAAQKRGLRVPEDIAIVGFDDVPLASYVSPALTTVHQPIYEQGVYAARIALDILKSTQKQPPAPPRIILPTSLVIRRSCGCEP